MLVNYGGVTTQSLLGSPSTLSADSKVQTQTQTQTQKDKEPDFLKGAADEVSTDVLLKAWAKADKDQNGVTSREEMAGAAYSLLTKDDASEEEKGIGRILATLATGGKEGTGLSEFYNDRDGGVSRAEIKELAKRDGLRSQVSLEDLQSALGTRYVENGQDLSLARLKEIGKVPNNPGNGDNNNGDLGNIFLDFLKQIAPLLQALIDRLSGGGSSDPLSTRPQASKTSAPLQQAALPALATPGKLSNPFNASLGLGGINPLSAGFTTSFSAKPLTGTPTAAPASLFNTNLTQSLLSLSSGMLQLASQSLTF